jgi:hypothetical protein
MGESWLQVVKRVYNEKLAQDPEYQYKQAMIDAKPFYKSGSGDSVSTGVKSVASKKSHKKYTKKHHKKSKKAKKHGKKSRKARK